MTATAQNVTRSVSVVTRIVIGYAEARKSADGDTNDLMLLLGWTSDAPPRHYSARAAAERAQETQLRMGIGEHV